MEVSEETRNMKKQLINTALHIVSKQEILCYLELGNNKIGKVEIFHTLGYYCHFDRNELGRVVALSNRDSSTQRTNYKKSQSKPYMSSHLIKHLLTQIKHVMRKMTEL